MRPTKAESGDSSSQNAYKSDHDTHDPLLEQNDLLDTSSSLTNRSGIRFGPMSYRPVLIAISGPGRGATHQITRKETVVGRGGEADFRLVDSGSSRAHARIIFENIDATNEIPRCYIEDLGSRNGTEVNGRRIEGRRLMQERDRVSIGRTVIGYFLRDDAEQRHDELLYESATRDPLTGLDNRRQFLALLKSHLSRIVRNKSALSLLMIDADYFKNINDTYGHDVGDEVLKLLSRILRSTCRDSDLVGRWGGEEFVVALPDSKLPEAILLAERIRKTVAASEMVFGASRVRLTVSVGVAEFDSNQPADVLFRKADEQLYRAKNAGRNVVAADDAIHFGAAGTKAGQKRDGD